VLVLVWELAREMVEQGPELGLVAQVPLVLVLTALVLARASKTVYLDQTVVAVELVLHREELALVVDKEKEWGLER
jgi:hypothetical protein